MAAFAVAFLAACGGGGGGGSGAPPVSSPGGGTVVAALPVTLSAPSADVIVAEGAAASFGFVATYSGTSSQPIVADVRINGERLVLDGAPVAAGTQYRVNLKTVALPIGGKSAHVVTFRLCTSADCATVYPDSTQTFSVNLDVQLKDWSTFQRDAAHTGYVAVNYRTADFADSWSVPTGAFRPSEIAAQRGKVFTNVANSNRRVSTKAIDSGNGSLVWDFDLGAGSYFSGPSYGSGRVTSMAMDLSSSSIPMPVIDAANGALLRALSFDSQFSRNATPTPVGDELYYQAGYYGNVVYSDNWATGSRRWRKDATQPGEGVVQEGESVAVDSKHVYFFGGGNLLALSRADGSIVAKIRNPFFTMFGLSYYGTYSGAPILDAAGRIFTFTSNRGGAESMPLMAFSLSSTTPLWRTSAAYTGHPALRDGRLYAIRGGTAIIDAIDVANGTVLGSTDLGAERGPLGGNIVITGSHLFVSNGTATYALDLQQAGFPVVWTAPRGGALAITPDNQLIVSASSGLFAYKLG